MLLPQSCIRDLHEENRQLSQTWHDPQTLYIVAARVRNKRDGDIQHIMSSSSAALSKCYQMSSDWTAPAQQQHPTQPELHSLDWSKACDSPVILWPCVSVARATIPCLACCSTWDLMLLILAFPPIYRSAVRNDTRSSQGKHRMRNTSTEGSRSCKVQCLGSSQLTRHQWSMQSTASADQLVGS